MDIAALAATISGILIPHLPTLLKSVADGAAKSLGTEAGKQALELPKKLWELLWPKLEANPAASESVKDAEASPNDNDTQAAVRKEIKKILSNDSALAEILAKLLENSGSDFGNQYTATAGDGGVAVARDLHGGVKINNNFNSK